MSEIPFPLINADRMQAFLTMHAVLLNTENPLAQLPKEYDPRLIPILRAWYAGIKFEQGKTAEAITELPSDEDALLMLEKRLMTSINSLAELELEVMKGKDVGDKVNIQKNLAGLMEKLLDLRTNISRVKQVEEFKSAILSVLESVMTPDQRTSVMKKLESYL